MSEEKKLFQLVATAIILREPYHQGVAPRYLIAQRSDTEKSFPSKWVVPGGKMTTDDYTDLPKETEHYWYNVIEKALRREVKEEVNLDIKNIWYVTSLARLIDSGNGSLVLSFAADYDRGEVKLDKDMQGYEWVTFEEAKNYDLMDGILEELWMTEQKLAGRKDVEWQRLS